MSKNSFFKNTFILILSNFLIKILGLFNRVLLTRLLGNEGISLYIICLPTIILFISLCGFSLNNAMSKVVAMNNISQKYTNRQILKQAFMLATIVSLVGIIILMVIINPLTTKWLRQPNAYYPILASTLFLPLVAYNNCLRGYFNGLKKVDISAYAALVEQIARIIASVLFLYIFLDRGILFAVTMTIIAMTIGELVSFLFAICSYFKIKRPKIRPYTPENPRSELLKIAVPATSSKLVGSLTYFLEPILYTAALSIIGYNSIKIGFLYSEYSAYAEGLLTMFSFISASIAVSIIPHISESLALQDFKKIGFYIKKTLLASILPGLLFTILLIFYADEYMNFVYNTTTGAQYVKQFAILFLATYLVNPLVSIMNSLGKAKETFILSSIFNVLKLVLIFTLVFIPNIEYYSLIIATSVSLLFLTIIIYFRLKNLIYFKFTFSEKLNLVIIIVLTLIVVIFLKNILMLNYLIVSASACLIFIISLFILRIFQFDYK